MIITNISNFCWKLEFGPHFSALCTSPHLVITTQSIPHPITLMAPQCCIYSGFSSKRFLIFSPQKTSNPDFYMILLRLLTTHSFDKTTSKSGNFLGSIFGNKQTKCIPGEKLGIIYRTLHYLHTALFAHWRKTRGISSLATSK